MRSFAPYGGGIKPRMDFYVSFFAVLEGSAFVGVGGGRYLGATSSVTEGKSNVSSL